MMELLILLMLNSLLCVGLFSAWQFEYQRNDCGVDEDTKGILWFYKFHFLDKINYRISKPLGNCLTCMGSVFSFVPYWWHNQFDFTNFDALVLYPFYILALAGLNRIIDRFIND